VFKSYDSIGGDVHYSYKYGGGKPYKYNSTVGSTDVYSSYDNFGGDIHFSYSYNGW
jgi:hypothetical protein